MEFVYGFFIGALTIGSTTYRTMKVIEGRVLAVMISSVVHSLLYLASMKQIIDNNMDGYIGFSAGAALATMYLALKQRNK
jgi:dienelactone hydrolase